MDWKILSERILHEIQPTHRGILKCQESQRRSIVSNDGEKIGIRTGVKTKASKTISYEMIHFAFDRLMQVGEFDSKYFQTRYEVEYKNGPCRYSMIGGILVEFGLAEQYKIGNRWIYRKKIH